MDRILIGVLAGAFLFLAPKPAAAEGNLLHMLDKSEEDESVMQTKTSLAVSLAFSSSTWIAVGVSTSAPHRDMAELMYKKYYRLEVVQMILMAERSGKNLEEIAKLHVKDKTLRSIATDLGLKYEKVLDDAVAKMREIVRRAEDLATVRSGSPPKP